jgi:hypothetical protein
MAGISLISSKSVLLKLADMFQTRSINVGQSDTHPKNVDEYNDGYSDELVEDTTIQHHPTSHKKSEEFQKSKLNITLGDLKIISTALLQYKRSLSKIGELQRAEGVGQIDKKFYELILNLESQPNHITQEMHA